MAKYEIEGGFPIKGKVRASGNKNAALPCLAAAILTDEEVTISNVPEIEDVKVLLSILEALGATVRRVEHGTYSIKATNIVTEEVPLEAARDLRASILLVGPMVARVGKVVLPPPGGDVIGRRRLDTHFLAISELGGRFEIDGVIRVQANKLIGVDIFLDEASVTATENAIMAACLAEGTTILQNAASEPHVQDLCNMLNSMGAKITGVGSNILTIHGVKKLKGTRFEVGTDFMEVGSLIGLAAVTRGDLEIENAAPEHLRMTKVAFNKLGIHWETEGTTIRIHSGQERNVVQDLGGMIPRIDDAPWPGFPTDLMSIMIVVATQVNGTVLFHEKMFESRMFFVDALIGMGARIVLCDPHRAVVSGPSRLRGSVLVSPDVRAGMSLVIAALCAEGTSLIHNVYQIERGYEDIAGRLRSLGARIKRLDD